MGRFDDRCVVVTGGSSGIGRATVHAFAAEGAHVVAVGRCAGRLGDACREAEGGTVESVCVDVRDLAADRRMLRDVVDRLGRLDVLVNCAGIALGRPLLEMTEEEWDDTIATNLTSAVFLSQEAARHMVAAGGGAIVNVASICAYVSETPDLAYSAAKAGMVMLTKCTAYELGHLGVRCNAVAPGLTFTPMLERDLDDEPVYHESMRRIPLRRPSLPGEQAAAILFLASDEASYVNGEVLVVDGGQLSGFWYDPRMEPPVPPWAGGEPV